MSTRITEFRGKDCYIVHDELLRTPNYSGYLATAERTGQRFIIKALKQEHYDLDMWLQREAKALSGTASERIVRLHDYGTTASGHFFLVMEDAQGLLLSQWSKQHGQVDEFTALRMMQQLGLALKDVAALRLIHQGIDPSSIIVCSAANNYDEFVVKLWDFGLAQTRRMGHIEEPYAGFKQLGFLAPEQVTGKEIDTRTDIYAIGAVAYWLLTGLAPYEGDSPMQLYKQIGREDIEPQDLCLLRPDLSAEAAQVIMRCLAYQPERRFTSAEQLLKSLRIRPDRLDFLYERARRAETRGEWNEILDIANEAKDLSGARVRFRDLTRRARKMQEEETIDKIKKHKANIDECIAQSNLQEAEEELRRLEQIANHNKDLAVKVNLQDTVNELQSTIQLHREFKPAYLESTMPENEGLSDSELHNLYRYELLRPTICLGRQGQYGQPVLDLVDVSGNPVDKSVSRRHAWLDFRDGAWRIRAEHKASNRTYVNDIALIDHEEYPLVAHDIIRLGNVRLTFNFA